MFDKLHTLVIQNMLTMGESRDMSRIYIALQGILYQVDIYLFNFFPIVQHVQIVGS